MAVHMNPKEIEQIEKLASQIFDAEQEELQTKAERDAYKGIDISTRKALTVKSVVAYAKAHTLRSALHKAIHQEDQQ